MCQCNLAPLISSAPCVVETCRFSNLCLQLTLALLQLRDASGTLRQHGLLLLQRKLQLNVLLVTALANQSGTAELLLQGESLRSGESETQQTRRNVEGETERRPGSSMWQLTISFFFCSSLS